MPIAPKSPDSPSRRAALFRNGRNQALRIPREFEIQGSEVLVHREGVRLIITPVVQNPLAALLASWKPISERLPEVEDLPIQERRSL